jgi:hypothetical protein
VSRGTVPSTSPPLQFTDDPSIGGCISEEEEEEEEEEVVSLRRRSGENNLQLGIGKTKELVVAFLRLLSQSRGRKPRRWTRTGSWDCSSTTDCI